MAAYINPRMLLACLMAALRPIIVFMIGHHISTEFNVMCDDMETNFAIIIAPISTVKMIIVYYRIRYREYKINRIVRKWL